MTAVRPLILVGTRPEAIKLAPVIAECSRHPREIDAEVCLTGQHRGLLTPFVDYFDIPVHHDLKAIRSRQNLSDLTARMLKRITKLLQATVTAGGGTGEALHHLDQIRSISLDRLL